MGKATASAADATCHRIEKTKCVCVCACVKLFQEWDRESDNSSSGHHHLHYNHRRHHHRHHHNIEITLTWIPSLFFFNKFNDLGIFLAYKLVLASAAAATARHSFLLFLSTFSFHILRFCFHLKMACLACEKELRFTNFKK